MSNPATWRAIFVCATVGAALTVTSCTPPPSTTPRPMPLEIHTLECPELLILGSTESYDITFQVSENGQPAKAGIAVTFLVGDTNSEISPREASTDEQGQVTTNVTPIWQDRQRQSISIGATILPQRVGATCTTDVQLRR
jgi:hypothetical protein